MTLLAAASPGEVRVAAVDDAGLRDYAIWRPGAPDGVGDLHRGRVIACVPALAGAFVALGGGAEGFLPDSAGGAGVTAGQVLAVRITRAAQGGKGPRLAAATDAAAGTGAPALLRRGPDAVQRLAALYPAAPVWADDAALVAALRPLLGERVRVVARAFDDETEAAVAALAEPEADLPGGMRCHVYPTPALTAIDLDLGAAAAERGGKASVHQAANRAALPALARQIRLRNLSGAILVDLAGMSPKRRAALGPDLAAALADDPLRPKLLGFTALGLAEIVRPRVHPPLHELLAGPHAAGLAALRHLAAEIAARPGRTPALAAAPAVVAALQDDTAARADLARRAGQPLILRSDPALAPLGWRIAE
ncbi:MAG TPA: ribonuclease E/G [Acetobacteraceae bacterium]|nr:ribonuclease E/G [Acetobacteraceae bacterium]